jgi:hypothetical protein
MIEGSAKGKVYVIICGTILEIFRETEENHDELR